LGKTWVIEKMESAVKPGGGGNPKREITALVRPTHASVLLNPGAKPLWGGQDF